MMEKNAMNLEEARRAGEDMLDCADMQSWPTPQRIRKWHEALAYALEPWDRLVAYIQHLPSCSLGTVQGDTFVRKCSCGLHAALREEEK